jgi:outer membrane protein assembly factor BamB
MPVIRISTGGSGSPGDPPGRRRRRLLGLGLVIALAIGLPILMVGGVGLGLYRTLFRVPELRALLFEGGRIARGAVLPLADGAVVLSQENAQPVAEAVRSGARQSGAARVYLTRIGLPPTDKARWDLALDAVTGPDAGLVRLWLDGDRVLVAFRERLEARALGTGASLWTATMSDAIHGACRQCLAVGGGRVVVLAADGVAQAFDGATGRALWRAETRLNRPTAPDLEIAGDLVGVVDRGPGAGPVELLLVRADSGQPVRRIRPGCARQGSQQSPQQSPSTDTTQAEYAGDRVVLALGRAGTASCFEAWDVRRGALVWQAPLPRPGPRIEESRVPWYAASGRGLSLGQASVGAGSKGAVWTLAFDTGRLRSLPVPEGYETRVLDARDGVLILRATRQRGTMRDELWAMALDTGAVLWEKPLGSTGGAAPRWTARVVSTGVALLQALERPNRLAYEALDLRTGRSLASVTAEVEAASWEGVAWTDEAAWLTIASPYHVGLRAGTVTRAWPWQSLANCQNIGGKIVCTR